MPNNLAPHSALAAAQAARARQQWRQAAVLFTDAADAIAAEPGPHGQPMAAEISLRRDAHLMLCRTPQFLRHRERNKGELHPDEWIKPTGDLVRKLLRASAGSEPRTHRRGVLA